MFACWKRLCRPSLILGAVASLWKAVPPCSKPVQLCTGQQQWNVPAPCWPITSTLMLASQQLRPDQTNHVLPRDNKRVICGREEERGGEIWVKKGPHEMHKWLLHYLPSVQATDTNCSNHEEMKKQWRIDSGIKNGGISNELQFNSNEESMQCNATVLQNGAGMSTPTHTCCPNTGVELSLGVWTLLENPTAFLYVILNLSHFHFYWKK